MNNLTTRKIVLGLLMTLVLALGVQGTADALTLGKGDGDFRSATDDVEFEITFTPALNSNVANESVKISASRALITSVGFGNPFTPSKTPHTLKEGEADNEALTGREVTVTCIASSPGEVTITVSDTTSSTELRKTDPDTPKAPNLVFTVYVEKHALDVDRGDTVSLLGVTNGVGAGYDNRGDVKIHSGSGTNPVRYTVSGGGTLYIREGSRYRNADDSYIKSDTDGTLDTSSGADVWLAMSGNSNIVTAEVSGGDTENQGVYIFGRPTLRVATQGQTLSPTLSHNRSLEW